MQEYPPPYELATARDAWAIVAPYIPSADLCSASLVCQRWHQRFVPFLWGSPASHFGSDNDAMYVALTRFRRTLTRSRPWVRCLTHTLHLPPALTEIYGGPRATWLLEVLEYLPNLQSLLVSQLPFFDHNALTALQGREQREGQSYGLRLLLAQSEPNTTSVGIAGALLHFPKLIYLDLSYTTPARDFSVLSVMSQLLNLQVLKLRAIGLRDQGAEVLANAIGTRVRLLDLRNNYLTDTGLRSLMQACFLPPEVAPDGADSAMFNSEYAWSRPGARSSNTLTLDSLKSENFAEHLLAHLMKPITGRFKLEDLPQAGITHLYVADNSISVEGLGSLLGTSRLHLLDGGTVDTAESIKKRNNISKESLGDDSLFVTTVRFPGAEKLITTLGGPAANNLTYLRVHHAVITENTPSNDTLSMNTLLPELPDQPLDKGEIAAFQTAELEATDNEKHEMPVDFEPIFELGDTSIPTQQERETREGDEPATIHQSGISGSHLEHNGQRPIPSAPESSSTPVLRLPPEGADLPEPLTDDIPFSPSRERAEKIEQLKNKRPKGLFPRRRQGRTPKFPYLHPSHIPHLRTLILTDVPSSVPPSSPILKSLIRFLTACSDEALLASLQARSNYSLPPGWARANAELQNAKSLFSLERIVLEITPVRNSEVNKGPSAWMPQGYYNPGVFKSSTGDTDSENLWAAAVDDFSFFGDEECGVPDNDPRMNFPMSALNEKVSLTPEEDESKTRSGLPAELHSPALKPLSGRSTPISSFSGSTQGQDLSRRTPSHLSPTHASGFPANSQQRHIQQQQSPQPLATPPERDIDLVQTLAAFRRSKRTEYEETVRTEQMRRSFDGAGLSSPQRAASPVSRNTVPLHVEGHWKGQMQVVRNPTPKGRSGVVDIYGNYFEKGYLYP